jgi:ethanolamine transporter EutH
MVVNALIPILISALTAGLFGALKFYSNTLGSDPETFELKKFLPIVVLSVIISVGFAFGAGDMITSDQIVEYLTANFMLVIFANTVYSIVQKKYPNLLSFLTP